MRRTVANRLTEAKQNIPHFYLRKEARIDELLRVRARLNAHLAEKNNKLSINDFIIKSCASALQSVPTANAIWAEDKILQPAHRHCNQYQLQMPFGQKTKFFNLNPLM